MRARLPRKTERRAVRIEVHLVRPKIIVVFVNNMFHACTH